MQAEERALADLLTTQVEDAPELGQLREQACARFVRLAQRAQDAGSLRADFVPEDLVVLLMANAGLVRRTVYSAPHARHRFVDRRRHRPPPPTPSHTPCANAVKCSATCENAARSIGAPDEPTINHDRRPH